jgi:hypothetical protein
MEMSFLILPYIRVCVLAKWVAYKIGLVGRSEYMGSFEVLNKGREAVIQLINIWKSSEGVEENAQDTRFYVKCPGIGRCFFRR